MTPEAPEVREPQHALTALTTFELKGYRQELERAIAFFDRQEPVPPVRVDLSARLESVVAEQEARSAGVLERPGQ